MKVLVVGAGVGGLALARGLHAHGHEVRVLERGAGLRTGGAGVTIFSNGAAALAGLGAPLPPDIGGRIELLDFRTAAGSRIYRSDVRRMERATGFPATVVSRKALLEHLAADLPPGTVQFGAGVEAVQQASGRVEAVDGLARRYRADALVGADGHRSIVRRSVDREPARSTGWATWQGLTRILPEVARGTRGLMHVGTAGFVGIMPAGDGYCQWWFDVPLDGDDAPPERPTMWLRERFRDFASPVPDLLEGIDDRDIGFYPHVAHWIPDRWGRGPVTLLGDAAHAFPPTQAQGANQALEDAWMLTRALNRLPDPVTAVRRYEALRSVRVRRVARLAVSETTDKVPPAAVRLLARTVPAGLAGRVQLAMLRRWSSVLNDEEP